MRAVSHANRLLSWAEDLEEGEFPPDWMCPFDELLVDHFAAVVQGRKERYGGSSDDSEDMTDNEYAMGRG